jgi:hypothetical protein
MKTNAINGHNLGILENVLRMPGLHKTGLLRAVISELEQCRMGKSGCKDQNVPLHIPELYYFSSGSSHVISCGGLKWACCTSS